MKEDTLLRYFRLGEIETNHLSISDRTGDLASTNDKIAWEELIEADLNVKPLIFLPYFERSEEVLRQGPIIYKLGSSPARSKLCKAHPCREGFAIWRPVISSLGPEDGLFKVYPGSHSIRTEEELRHREATELRIRADQILIMRGGNWIEQGVGGSGLLMWAGVSREIVGLYIDKHSLKFVASAFGAERFLAMDHPFGMTNSEPVIFDRAFQDRIVRSNSRSVTATNLLINASNDLIATQNFLEKLSDPSGLILRSENGKPEEDPRIKYATVRSLDPKGYFLRALTLRYLSRRLREIPNETIANFLRNAGLKDPTRSVTQAIQNGLRMSFVETETHEPGLWLVLMSVLSRFHFMSDAEVQLVPNLLLNREHEGLLNAGRKYSGVTIPYDRGHFGSVISDPL
ncbi:hypothetical protein N7468_009857 [Penicillium chermesinum]|uniref:Uncharacterized protein n=1 Tax=Penicillium chermesinum TaxID=63820 RepID=A0A9W9NDB5_9EURO|nr:uncharacterized protein N7468_009857 [Penicillium chermesinum]KAJ5216849.1 hypothetical protein N7468_009857 [Penicillium chermesinum]KAJ6171533.1 hypothetical protein N7470_000600 [Penicillium chermesinum]